MFTSQRCSVVEVLLYNSISYFLVRMYMYTGYMYMYIMYSVGRHVKLNQQLPLVQVLNAQSMTRTAVDLHVHVGHSRIVLAISQIATG